MFWTITWAIVAGLGITIILALAGLLALGLAVQKFNND